MNTSSVNNYYNSTIESVLSSALQGTNLSTSNPGSNVSSVSGTPTDSSQLSPFAQLLSTLQQLQQSNPTQYQQVTQQIAKNLQSAAQTAQSNGNTSQSNQLNQLATDFTNASTSGQLPNVQDLASAIGGGHGGGHHHHVHSSSSDSDSASSSSTSNSSTIQSLEQQLLAAFQSNGTASNSNSLNPLSIIQNTLSNAGITGITT